MLLQDVTKVMTLLLIFDALEEGKIALEDDVQTSEYAGVHGWITGVFGAG